MRFFSGQGLPAIAISTATAVLIPLATATATGATAATAVAATAVAAAAAAAVAAAAAAAIAAATAVTVTAAATTIATTGTATAATTAGSEAIGAVHRTAAGGLEGDLGLLSALGAYSVIHLAGRTAAEALRGASARAAPSLGRLAGRAAIGAPTGLAGKSFGRVELLFTGRKDKVRATIGASKVSILVEQLRFTPSRCDRWADPSKLELDPLRPSIRTSTNLT